MLPLIADSVLQTNPKFAALHESLAKSILNSNGSTKSHPAQKERDAVTESLREYRLRAAKAHFLKSALENLDLSAASTSSTASRSFKAPPKQLPPELVELILLLSTYFTTRSDLSSSSLKLLRETSQWASLPGHLSRIGTLLSLHLQSQALALCRIHNTSTNASFLHRSIPKLVPAIQAQQLEIQNKKYDLEQRRVGLVSKVSMLLGLFHLASTLVILHLEQTAHGSVARWLRSRSELLLVTAQHLELEAKWKRNRGEKLVYTDPVKNALVEYYRTLRDARERLKERGREAERTLWEYGVGRSEGDKERVMRNIADKYAELRRELKEIAKDVDRLKGQ